MKNNSSFKAFQGDGLGLGVGNSVGNFDGRIQSIINFGASNPNLPNLTMNIPNRNVNNNTNAINIGQA